MSASAHELVAGQDHGVRSEADQVPGLRIVLVGLGALLVFLVGSLLAVGYLHGRQLAAGPIAVPPEVGDSKVGLVEQQLFARVERGEQARARDQERLASYGWVDRKAGVAHIPIDEAMRLVAAGVRPAGSEPATPPFGGRQ
ncbi:MAG TPA: hypothetical protein VMU15_07960 [Anaeromyxobacter sp.]|nr:hypothetical protein [Anaeromyxobacter sp.]